MKKIKINGIDCIIQAYKDGDFANICPINCDMSSVRIEFWNNRQPFSTTGKETEMWRHFISGINVQSVERELKAIFQL